MILEYETNIFNGAVINSENLTKDSTEFIKQLDATIDELKTKELQLVWLFLGIERCNLVPIAVGNGFIYHHADENGILLTLKLTKDAFIPGYATHYIGAGGVVINDKNEILIIQEKSHQVKHYKLPGGTLDPGEHISTAVVREVFEETGIKTEFISVNSFRHFHGYRYGKSDIYFVCRLKPLTLDISIDPNEISKSLWMPVDEYLTDPDTHIFNKEIVRGALKDRGLKIKTIPDYKNEFTHEILF